MARINLLPWREELRRQQQIEFLTLTGVCAVIAAIVWGGIHFYVNSEISYQETRNQFVQNEIALLDKKIKEIDELELKKERLIARMRAIETLQSSRPLIVRLFDEVVRVLPDGVYIKEITQQDKRVTVRGSAQSNARVSTMMRNVEASEWLTRPTLNVIQAQNEDGQRIAEFTLVVEQAGVAAPEETAQAKPSAKAKAPAARGKAAAKGNAAAKGGA